MLNSNCTFDLSFEHFALRKKKNIAYYAKGHFRVGFPYYLKSIFFCSLFLISGSDGMSIEE